ncbi:MAG TPA: luciferase family protein [Anaerolineae bacterium]
MGVENAQTQINQAVAGWEGVTLQPHRFGGTEYLLGKREFGHIHGNSLIDIPFPTRVARELVAAGRAEPHHILPDSGWVSFYLREEADIQRGIDLLRMSYEIAVKQKAQPQHKPLTSNL